MDHTQVCAHSGHSVILSERFFVSDDMTTYTTIAPAIDSDRTTTTPKTARITVVVPDEEEASSLVVDSVVASVSTKVLPPVVDSAVSVCTR